MADSELYKTTGIIEQVDDNPENPNQPKQPAKIIPRSIGNRNNPIIAIPIVPKDSLFGHWISLASDSVPSPGGYNPPPGGPNGNYVLLSDLIKSGYSGQKLPSDTKIIDDLPEGGSISAV